MFAVLLVATRWPLTPWQLFSGDDINFAYAIGRFDIRVSQPQPPGYPVFVLETRVLNLLRVKRAESNFRILALLGSVAAVWLLVRTGHMILERSAGLWAAWLFLFHPSFWFAGITSPVRVQLAVVSLAVGGACWRMLHGNRNWTYWSSLLLGIGAGIRPELGLLLLPLWLWCLFRGEPGWARRLASAGVLAVAVLAWLIPASRCTGGLWMFIRVCWVYLANQSSDTSGLFGASALQLLAALGAFTTWTLGGVPAYALPAMLAWTRSTGFGFTRTQILFLLVWLLPLACFALFVHIGDPGHALSMVPVICLAGGRLIERALERWRNSLSRLEVFALVVFASGLAGFFFRVSHLQQLLLLPALSAAAAAMLLYRRRAIAGWLPAWQGGLVLLMPTLFLDAALFLQPGWYAPPSHTSGVRALLDQFWSDVNIAVSLSNLELVRSVANTDDGALRQIRERASEKTGQTHVIWVKGLTYWRKVSYYFPGIPVIVVTHKTLSPESPATLVLGKGPQAQVIGVGSPPLPLRIPAGERLIWLIKPDEGLGSQLTDRLGAICTGAVCFNDLPQTHGSRDVGAVRLIW